MKHRRGFTMIEILVACGVIVVLLGLLFLGGRAIINSKKRETTVTMLHNLAAMVTEREAAVGATKVKQEVNALFLDPTVPLAISNHSFARDMPDRVPQDNQLVGMTQDLIRLLIALPGNKAAFARLPEQQMLEKATLDLAAADRRQPPVILDGFDNPILVMPGIGVEIAYETGVRVVRSPDGKPFFMSAGADGFFSLDGNNSPCGDDNVYSFEK